MKDAQVPRKSETNVQVIYVINAWNPYDFLRMNYVLNSLSDSLYNVYTIMKKAKELCVSLYQKYKTDEANAKLS